VRVGLQIIQTLIEFRALFRGQSQRLLAVLRNGIPEVFYRLEALDDGKLLQSFEGCIHESKNHVIVAIRQVSRAAAFR